MTSCMAPSANPLLTGQLDELRAATKASGRAVALCHNNKTAADHANQSLVQYMPEASRMWGQNSNVGGVRTSLPNGALDNARVKRCIRMKAPRQPCEHACRFEHGTEQHAPL